MLRPWRRRREGSEERGATVVVVALVMTVLLIVTAFAVDIGMQRVGRANMQALADVVALDLARHLDGSSASALTAELDTERDRSVARHASDYGGQTPTVTYQLGSIGSSGAFVAGTDPPSAVKVTATTSVGFAFGGVTGVASGNASRPAVATSDTEACFRLGSYALRLDSSSSTLLNAILGGMLGSAISLDAVSYKGLANADIDLLDIATQLGLGSVDELLTTNVSASNLLIAAATVLNRDGNTASANILNTIAAKIGGHSISVGSLLSAASGSTAAETATINAFDLVTGTVFVADGSSAISIPSLGVNLGLTGTGLTSTIKIIQKPSRGCGKKSAATADTSQVAVNINGDLLSPGSVLGLPLTASTTITAAVAPAHGVLTDVICGSETAADPSGEDVLVTSGLATASALLHVAVNASTSDSSSVGGLIGGITSLLNLLGLNKIASIQISGSIDLSVATSSPSTGTTVQIRVPNSPPDWSTPVSSGSGDLGLNTLNVSQLNSTLQVTAKNFLGLNVSLNTSQTSAILSNLVTKLVSQTLDPLLTSVNTTLLSPLEDILGLSLGGADVFGEKPVCGNPSLVG